VVGITNKLSVTPSEKVLDEIIGEQIMAALDRNANVDVNTVHVKVEDGHVTLSGEVPSWNARRAAYECALNTGGVVDVEDDLIIQSFV
jgi:osmotically-inducible protein OsmY